MRRREFLGVLGGAAAWPLTARAQQSRAMHRVGILIGAADDSEFRPRVHVFVETLRGLGWKDGENVSIDIRWNPGGPQQTAALARELLALKPDVILAGPTRALIPLQKETSTIPIVFISVSDPLGQGIVKSLARPTGNLTGFSNLEFSLVGKWLQILKEAAPRITRVGLMISTGNAVSPQWYQMFNKVAPTIGIEPVAAPIKDRADIERVVKSLSTRPDGGLIVAGDTFVETPSVRRLIIDLTATHKLPALYGVLTFAREGALLSYGIDQLDPYRGAATYVDRILKGEKPADLPVQQPTKFHFVINLRTAKALGLDPSTTLVAAADEVIE